MMGQGEDRADGHNSRIGLLVPSARRSDVVRPPAKHLVAASHDYDVTRTGSNSRDIEGE